MSDTEEEVEQEEHKEDSGQEEQEDKEEKQTTKHVEMDDETQKRFNRIYGNMKQYERVVHQMGQENRALLERLEKLEGRDYEREVTGAVDRLKKDKISALDDGDHARVAEIDDQIAQIRSLPEPKPAAQRTEDISAYIPPQDQQMIHAWGNETNEDGSFKRPWAQVGHPGNNKAAAIGAAVLEDAEIVAQGTAAILAEVDRLMGLENKSPARRTSSVLSNDKNVSGTKEKKTKLTNDEKLIAQAMGISEERYLKSKQEMTK